MKSLSEQDTKMLEEVLNEYIKEHLTLKRTAREENMIYKARLVIYKVEKQKAAKTTG